MLAADMTPGTRFTYRDTVCEVLKPREDRDDRFGRPMDAWWCKRLDTGHEGYLIFGPQLGALPCELIDGDHPGKCNAINQENVTT